MRLACLDGRDVCGVRECIDDTDCSSGVCITEGSRRGSCGL